MATPAAVLAVLVKAEGVAETARKVRDLDADLDKAGKTGSRTAGALKKVGGIVGGIVAFETLRRGVGAAVSEFEEARKVGAQTEQVIKTTGGAANVTAKHVANLAGAISRKVGVDDEAIQSGANLLLTFKNVRNEVGKGNAVFDRATQAAVDLSAAGFGDLSATSKQLGKALNDPIKGISALSRSGVTFTEQQKEKIKSLVEEGKALKAQKIILKEVESQVSGSAAAQASALDKAKIAVGNLAEAAGAVLVPAFDKAARIATTFINQMIESKGAGGALVSVFRTTGTVIGDIIGSISSVVGWFRQHETVTMALAVAAGVLLAAWAGFAIVSGITTAIMLLRIAFLQLTVAMLTNPAVLIVAALAALAAAVVIAYRESETFRNVVNAAWAAVRAAAGVLWSVLKTVFGGIVNVIRGAWEVIKTITTTYWSTYKTLIINPIREAFAWVRGAVGDAAEWLGGAWDTIRSAAGTAWAKVKTAIVDPIRDAVSAVRGALGKDGLIGWLGDRWEDMKKAADKMAAPFVAAFERMERGVKRVLDFLGKVVGAIKDVISFLGKIKIPKISLPDLNPLNGGAGNGTTVGPMPSLIGSGVDALNPIAAAYGNVVTSGFRPGDRGWHGQNRARDYAGGNMMGLARALLTMAPRLLELIYTPLGVGVKNGQVVPISYFGADVMADHYDHVHAAMEKGGHVLRSGWALVGEKGPELAHFPAGATVHSNQDSRAMLAGAGSGLTVNHYGDLVVQDANDRDFIASRLAFLVGA